MIRRGAPISRPIEGITPGSRSLVVAVLIGASLVGCRHRHSAATSSTADSTAVAGPSTSNTPPTGSPTYHAGVHPADPHALSPAEFQYGVSPTHSDAVTYQGNVVVMENGAEAIRSVSPDGLTWTFDANAPQVQDLQAGKVVFATSRAVGRVLAVQHNGNNVSVVVGPVELTDVIKEADLSYNQPLDLQSMVAYSAPNYPGISSDIGKLTSDASRGGTTSVVTTVVSPVGDVTPVAFVSNRGAGGLPRDEWSATDVAHFRSLQVPAIPSAPTIGAPSATQIGDFQTIPFCCGGLGIKVQHSGSDINLLAYAVLRLNNPSLQFNLKIHGGQVQTAKIVLNGAGGLTVHIESATATGVDGNINKRFYVPVDLSIPILGMPVPFAVTLHQQLVIKTGFSAKNSTLNTTGDYSFSGGIFMGLENGSWGVGAPTSFHINSSLGQSMQGVSLGATGMVFGMEGRIIVGIGAFGFVTGPYLGYAASVGLTRGSDLTTGLVGTTCRGSILDVALDVGIGYQIPQPVTNAINAILHTLNLSPIVGSGGLKHTEPLIHSASDVPKGCAYKT